MALSDLRSRENSMRSVEKFTGQHIPYTVPVVTEQRKVYSLSKTNSRFSQRLIQEGYFSLFMRDIKGKWDNGDGSKTGIQPSRLITAFIPRHLLDSH